MKYFGKCGSVQELKREYRRLAMLYHPDRGGDTAKMAEINFEYKRALDIMEHGGNYESTTSYHTQKQQKPKQTRKRKYYTEGAIRNFAEKYRGSGGKFFQIDSETWLFYGDHLKTVIIKEVSWFNGTKSYTTRFYNAMPAKYVNILEAAGIFV